ncbi:hypothetical protein CLV24_10588 [Pontibacter ummariensis]|uniref:Uncharacterized protein n=1 Tax=Pontibacter ummariensis TaxID=1610492 RepID=A0A239DYV0_9BACT|nr:hypothetical protein [Pontibacter ummariensis]PRY13718.1 hypothetical protein CLV24_10588 [Pontibacter ummariensis]SNS36824.1 hypothetical protein SAMN06296052_105163 [Pontibacter ummariensis]
MRKVFYTILTISILQFTMVGCGQGGDGETVELTEENSENNVDPDNLRGYGDREHGGLPPADPEADQYYGFDRDNLLNEIEADFVGDAELASRIVEVYYDRSMQLSELEAKLNVEGEPATDEAERQRQAIEQETDRQIREILSPEQYRTYEQNRSKYDQILERGRGETLQTEENEM